VGDKRSADIALFNFSTEAQRVNWFSVVGISLTLWIFSGINIFLSAKDNFTSETKQVTYRNMRN